MPDASESDARHCLLHHGLGACEQLCGSTRRRLTGPSVSARRVRVSANSTARNPELIAYEFDAGVTPSFLIEVVAGARGGYGEPPRDPTHRELMLAELDPAVAPSTIPGVAGIGLGQLLTRTRMLKLPLPFVQPSASPQLIREAVMAEVPGAIAPYRAVTVPQPAPTTHPG